MIVATEVAAAAAAILRTAGRVTVAARGSATYLAAGGAVLVAAAGREPGPLLANGLRVTAATVWPEPGAPVEIDLTGAVERTTRVPRVLCAAQLDEIVQARDPALDGVDLLETALVSGRDGAARAARHLIGRGPGLTPQGDDLLAGALAVLAGRGRTASQWIEAALDGDPGRRTTALSATLLRLAAGGDTVDVLADSLDATGSAAERRTAAERLVRLGSSTGVALGVGALCAARALTAPLAAPAHAG